GGGGERAGGGGSGVDGGGNPFTTPLVPRRVAPHVGGEVEVLAAYVETPALSVRPLLQRYRRVAADRWVYSDDLYGTFQFDADADGVAVDYQDLAVRK